MLCLERVVGVWQRAVIGVGRRPELEAQSKRLLVGIDQQRALGRQATAVGLAGWVSPIARPGGKAPSPRLPRRPSVARGCQWFFQPADLPFSAGGSETIER